ncbi:MAG: carboxypeptidase regulatory-like domain-containing protein [Ignavibacteriaceae bacterium]|nr:carboxypeptidase regulatory-like domain-containing protein [Ignavibacteriaceae bacterium]
MHYKFTIFFIVFNSVFLFAQPKLKLEPDEIEFEDRFYRNKNVYFINTGNTPLRIDSLQYKKSNYYFLRFNKPWEYPVILQPNDSVKMDCILESYVYVPAADTSDTLFIFNNGEKSIERLKVKIKYFDNFYGAGYVYGKVVNNVSEVANAKVSFFFNNNYLVTSTLTDSNGNYYVELPPGQYAVAVEKDSFYVSYYKDQFDPFNADVFYLYRDSSKIIDFNLERITYSGNSISGIITDSLSNARVKKGVLVVRTGTHTPNKISVNANSKLVQNGIYTTFIKPDGSYSLNGILIPGYYYVQAFSDYYIPSFYNFANKSAVFWQQADSIFINGSLSNININMKRDSSVGGGKISGFVTADGGNTEFSDMLIMAKSIEHELWYNYAFIKETNEFTLADLPYGKYMLYTQKIGFNNGVSNQLEISPSNKLIFGVSIPISLSNLNDAFIKSDEFRLNQNYPNPFNPETKITYYLPSKFESKNWVVQLKVFDLLGSEVAVLVNEEKTSGFYEINFNANNLSSGVYFYRLIADQYVATQKMIIVK